MQMHSEVIAPLAKVEITFVSGAEARLDEQTRVADSDSQNGDNGQLQRFEQHR